MSCHIWSKQKFSFLCESFHVYPNGKVVQMHCHIYSKQMVSLWCGAFHLPPPLWFPPFFRQSGVPLLTYSSKNIQFQETKEGHKSIIFTITFKATEPSCPRSQVLKTLSISFKYQILHFDTRICKYTMVFLINLANSLFMLMNGHDRNATFYR